MRVRKIACGAVRDALVGFGFLALCASIPAQQVLQRDVATVSVEPYAPNIVRVSLSLRHDDAVAAPGFGIRAKASEADWSKSSGPDGDGMHSSVLSVRVAPQGPKHPPTGTQGDIARFFNGTVPWVGLKIATADGKSLVDLQNWSMAEPNYKDGTAALNYDRRPTDPPFYTVSASFSAANDEHDYGMGQNQEGELDHRGHVLHCAHDYNAPSGQSVCVPFLVTNKGYGLIWDNPSRTTASFGFNGENTFSSEVGQRVSFFVIAGDYDAIYRGYRLLTGDTPIPPKSAFGYIQSKQRYTSQAELLGVAHGYRERHLPIDDLVIDWFHYTKMGQMDMDPAKWPDPTGMNRELHDLHFHTMISVWPRFVPDSRYYPTVLKNGWFMHLADGTPTNGLPYDRAGADIDTTNPEAAKWYWNVVKENYVTKGFDAFWADETEPDLPPNGSYFHIGPGTQFYNVYPLFHTSAFYDGMRRDTKQRALLLARDSYLGAQHNGAIFWSSDISPTWDVLKRQVPTGLNFVASGMPYWSTDIGGWQYLPGTHKPVHPPLLDPSDARDNVGGYDDYPELYTRWFQYGAFQPNFRSHGSRPQNEVWTYGKQAEPILEKYLRLRYQLMPYIYSLGYEANQTGAPFMRGLFLDFGNDPQTATIGDEYMFGPALLVAPVTEQGAITRKVYLPAGNDWYNFWTDERLQGGQWITASAPIDIIPLFVRAGSILPLGSVVESTQDKQTIARVRVYPGAEGRFTLYDDDGTTYAYEHGASRLTELHWDDAAGKLTQSGAKAWSGPDQSIVEVVGR
ncbi:TIM-barrel domain-containing protein [Terriglobus saanensis]|uniref:Glycoside hydrolase family 31 n=1 Tax=Terriglobus saanensis (strain ATCC BAA-1853 / DSM 23119 / SP1PR4) TaxID=401053 RepID=E8UYQ0_TERSS|nr:TIM-barrel domain-containing protein [Terriglobus saanensis]ADV83203.1 glycoside hydrolase family 31 [Terriglobus saanensis SP1PR4]